jgi:hypothetical protein
MSPNLTNFAISRSGPAKTAFCSDKTKNHVSWDFSWFLHKNQDLRKQKHDIQGDWKPHIEIKPPLPTFAQQKFNCAMRPSRHHFSELR